MRYVTNEVQMIEMSEGQMIEMSQWCDTAALDNCLSLFQKKKKPDVKVDYEAA